MTCHDPSSRSWYEPSRPGQRHHDRDLKHREPNMSKRVISGPLTIHVTIVSKRLQLVRSDVHSLHTVWDAHDLQSRSWSSILSPWPSCILHRFSLECSRSPVTIVSMLLELVIIKCLQDFILSTKSGTLMILRHDREQAIPARDLQLVNFQRSLGRSRSSVTIVSMYVELVTIIHLSQKMTLGRSRSYVTIGSKPS